MTSRYLIHTDKREFALEATRVSLIGSPSTKKESVYGYALILKSRTASEQLIAFISERDGQGGIEFIRDIVENGLRNLVAEFFTTSDPRNVLSTKTERIPSTDYIFKRTGETAPRALRGGSFGCIFKLFIKREKTYLFGGTRSIAVKFQIPEDKSDPKLKGEVYAAKRASNMDDYPKVNPFAVRVFRSYKISSLHADDAKFLRILTEEQCRDFYVNIQAKKPLRMIETEFVEKGSLFKLEIEDKVELSAEEMRSTMFQLCYSVIVMNATFALVHNDIKLENVLVKELGEVVRYRLHPSGETLLPGFQIELGGSSPMKYMMKLTDFGEAASDKFTYGKSAQVNVWQYRGGTPEFVPPDIWLYYDVKETESAQNLPTRDIASDVWSLGIVLVILALNGWDFEGLNLDTTTWKKLIKDGVFWGDSISDILAGETQTREFITQMSEAIKAEFKSSTSIADLVEPFDRESVHLIDDERDPRTIIAVSQLQIAIGNDLPTEGSVPPAFKFGQIHAYLVENKKKLVNLGKRWGKVVGRTRTRPMSDKSIFELAAERLKSRLGDAGFDFMKRCLSWSHVERKQFATDYAMNDSSLLGHRFFEQFRVFQNQFDYSVSSSSPLSYDYFFPLKKTESSEKF